MPKETNQEGQWLQRNKVTIQKKEKKRKTQKEGKSVSRFDILSNLSSFQ